MLTAFIALGSNLGDRARYLNDALGRLRAEPGLRLLRFSSFYETDPVGGPSQQGPYLNAVAHILTDHSPETLLRLLLHIEHSFGRTRTEPNAPRTLDLDLLLYADLVRSGPDPILPHPRMTHRRFVLEPLAEIAPDVVHPVEKVRIAELLQRLPDPPLNRYQSLVRQTTELAGLRTLVTGSTSGIGLAIATEFAAAGASVIVHGGHSRQKGENAVGVLQQWGIPVQLLMADLGDELQCQTLVESAWRFWGGLDVWVNNAGADTLTGEAATWTFERKLAELLAVDVTATMLLSRMAGERMKAQGSGLILTVGWDQAETGMEGPSGQLFCATKGAIMCFTRALALSLAPEVRVNCLAPGWIRTAWGEVASEVWQERVREETPLERWGLPEDVATAAKWLASPAARFITGQTIRINGGGVMG